MAIEVRESCAEALMTGVEVKKLETMGNKIMMGRTGCQ